MQGINDFITERLYKYHCGIQSLTGCSVWPDHYLKVMRLDQLIIQMLLQIYHQKGKYLMFFKIIPPALKMHVSAIGHRI